MNVQTLLAPLSRQTLIGIIADYAEFANRGVAADAVADVAGYLQLPPPLLPASTYPEDEKPRRPRKAKQLAAARATTPELGNVTGRPAMPETIELRKRVLKLLQRSPASMLFPELRQKLDAGAEPPVEAEALRSVLKTLRERGFLDLRGGAYGLTDKGRQVKL